MIDPVQLSQTLIQKPSLTPNDADCQIHIANLLSEAGFTCRDLSSADTKNLYAYHGKGAPHLLFVGHTDIVPAGEHWQHPPFSATIDQNKLYGRGAVDMKTAVAAMVSAGIDFASNHANHAGTIAFALTSDEEGPATNGSCKIVDHLKNEHQHFEYCVIGEPSSENVMGDMCKIGRRGSLQADITIHGKQGHVAYPNNAINPIHIALLALHTLCQQKWDEGNEHFPATQFQISNIHAGEGTENVIPGNMQIKSNFRFSPESSPSYLQNKVEDCLRQHQVQFNIDWRLKAEPFYFSPKTLAAICQTAIHETCQIQTCFSTTGGTSDGRFFQHVCDELIELGMPHTTAHQVDEYCLVKDIQHLKIIYQKIVSAVFAKNST